MTFSHLPHVCAVGVVFQGLVYVHMEFVLGDADWLIARLKTELTTPSTSDDSTGVSTLLIHGMHTHTHTHTSDESRSQPALTQAEGLCSSLCERMMNVVVGCSELVQSAVSPGAPTEGVLKVCSALWSHA